MTTSTLTKHRHGIALVLVMWMLSLLTVIAAGLAFSVRSETVLTGNHLSLVRAEALADAGIHRAIYELMKPVIDLETGWKADGRPQVLTLDDVSIKVVAVDETAFIDLNHAPEPLLRGLMVSVGLPDDEADRLVDAIVDWRDADDLVRTNGAERDQYEAAGLDYVPANANFQRIDELARVLGMTRDLYMKISGALTVYSGQPGINSSIAPRQVLLAMPSATPEEVDAYIEQRQALIAEGQPVPAFPPAAAYSASMASVYNLTSMARLPDGTVFMRNAVARQTQDIQRPFLFLDWKEGSQQPPNE